MVIKSANPPPTPDFVLALADVIRFIDKKRANANATPPPATDELPKAERPLAPPTKLNNE
jgi:hypothetical protein